MKTESWLVLWVEKGFGRSSLEPTNREECQRENGYCGFVKCRFPFVIIGRCSTFFFCCKK
uniref:Beta-defensin-like domain-containing protein n=1 Tax=Geospiza parvula TaxID=87175 RepID=A0A8C3N0R2_GEOPR